MLGVPNCVASTIFPVRLQHILQVHLQKVTPFWSFQLFLFFFHNKTMIPTVKQKVCLHEILAAFLGKGWYRVGAACRLLQYNDMYEIIF